MFALPLTAIAQGETAKDTTYWTKGGVFALDFSNVMLKNWAGGGVNAFSGKGLLNVFANWKKDNQTWDNTLELGYGMVNQFDTDPDDQIDDNIFFKSDDKIDFSSKYGRKASEKWYYSGLLNFKSQFAPGFARPVDFGIDSMKISDFLSPAYILTAIGMDYKHNNKEINSTFSMFISPITSKVTIVGDERLSNAGAFGVEKGEMVRSEIGGYIKFAYNRKFFEHKDEKGAIREALSFDTKLDIFANYIDKPGNLDINWTTLLSMKFMKYFTFSSGTHLIYDDDIKSQEIVTQRDPVSGSIIESRMAPGVQFKWVTGLGFTYQF